MFAKFTVSVSSGFSRFLVAFASKIVPFGEPKHHQNVPRKPAADQRGYGGPGCGQERVPGALEPGPGTRYPYTGGGGYLRVVAEGPRRRRRRSYGGGFPRAVGPLRYRGAVFQRYRWSFFEVPRKFFRGTSLSISVTADIFS